MSEKVENEVPTKAKLLKDLDAIIKETQVKLVVTITEEGLYSGVVSAMLLDIERLKRIKEALK